MGARTFDVAIIGGGFAGLTAALALARAGASVAVIERRQETNDPHRGDVLRPKGAALLKGWDVALTGARPILQLQVEVGARVVARRRFDPANPALCVPHPGLELALRAAAQRAGVSLFPGWQLQALQAEGAGQVRGFTAVSGADGVAYEAKVVVGADGRTSKVREALGLKMKQVGEPCALIALEAEPAPALAASQVDRVVMRLGPDGGSLSVPSEGRRWRFVVHTRPAQADRLSRLSPSLLAEELPGLTGTPAGAKVDPSRVRSYELGGAAHAQNYAARGVVCLGEAIHPVLPPSGEGLQMALLDAEALARHLGPALAKGAKAVAKAIDRFQLERWADNQRRVERANAATRWMGPLDGHRRRLVGTPLARLVLAPLLAVH